MFIYKIRQKAKKEAEAQETSKRPKPRRSSNTPQQYQRPSIQGICVICAMNTMPAKFLYKERRKGSGFELMSAGPSYRRGSADHRKTTTETDNSEYKTRRGSTTKVVSAQSKHANKNRIEPLVINNSSDDKRVLSREKERVATPKSPKKLPKVPKQV